MECDKLPTLLREWKAEEEQDETLLLIEAVQRIEERQLQMLRISSDLEGAYRQIVQKSQ